MKPSIFTQTPADVTRALRHLADRIDARGLDAVSWDANRHDSFDPVDGRRSFDRFAIVLEVPCAKPPPAVTITAATVAPEKRRWLPK